MYTLTTIQCSATQYVWYAVHTVVHSVNSTVHGTHTSNFWVIMVLAPRIYKLQYGMLMNYNVGTLAFLYSVVMSGSWIAKGSNVTKIGAWGLQKWVITSALLHTDSVAIARYCVCVCIYGFCSGKTCLFRCNSQEFFY